MLIGALIKGKKAIDHAEKTAKKKVRRTNDARYYIAKSPAGADRKIRQIPDLRDMR